MPHHCNTPLGRNYQPTNIGNNKQLIQRSIKENQRKLPVKVDNFNLLLSLPSSRSRLLFFFLCNRRLMPLYSTKPKPTDRHRNPSPLAILISSTGKEPSLQHNTPPLGRNHQPTNIGNNKQLIQRSF